MRCCLLYVCGTFCADFVAAYCVVLSCSYMSKRIFSGALFYFSILVGSLLEFVSCSHPCPSADDNHPLPAHSPPLVLRFISPHRLVSSCWNLERVVYAPELSVFALCLL